MKRRCSSAMRLASSGCPTSRTRWRARRRRAAQGDRGIADAPMTLLEAEVTLALADLSGALLDHPLLTRESVRERLQRP